MASGWKGFASSVKDALGQALDEKLARQRQSRRPSTRRGAKPPRARRRPQTPAPSVPTPGERDPDETNPGDITSGGTYPGDFTGPLTITYAPMPGDLPDPGEVVWTWVPYEEDHREGKDRPVLLIGRDGPWLLGLPLTSKDHDRDLAQEAAAGRHWEDVGSGSWDVRRRPSEARLDRIVRVDPSEVRRIGERLNEDVFTRVAQGVRRYRKA